MNVHCAVDATLGNSRPARTGAAAAQEDGLSRPVWNRYPALRLARLPLRWATLAAITVGLLIAFAWPAAAIEIPPNLNPTFIQTNGPQAPVERGDWYTSPDNGIGAGYHYFTINIPCSWPLVAPGGFPADIHIDIFSPGVNSGGGTRDELNGFPNGNGIFELYAPPTQVGPITNPDEPGPGDPISLGAVTYTPNLPSPNAGEDWFRFYTIPANAYDCTGAYVLRAETTGASENAWRVRLGFDNDNNPNNAPPANSNNPDGLPGTDDELSVGVARTSYQHDEQNQIICLTLLKFVDPDSVEAEFQNFDMDLDPAMNNARITYYAPSDTNYDPQGLLPGIFGTASGFTEWNNSPDVNRGPGDVIVNPEPGWWRIVACVNDANQYIVEGEFYVQPPTPRMIVDKDDGRTVVARGEVLNYVITFDNVSDQDPYPGAARAVVLVDELPPETTYVPGSCAIDPPYTGTCVYTPGTPAEIVYTLVEPVFAGDGGSVRFSARVNDDVFPPDDIENIVTLTYTDSYGRRFPPETANDIDITTLREPEMTLTKDDGRVLVARGDVLVYNIDFANISDTTPNPDTAENVVLTDTLPANVNYEACAIVPPFTGTCTRSGRTVVYTLNEPVVPGGSGRVTLTVRVAPRALDPEYNGEVYNTVTLTYTDSQREPQAPLTADDLDILVDTPLPRPLMTVMKDDFRELVQKGEVLTYRIDFRNIADTLPNPEPAYNVVLTDDVPGNTNYISCEILRPFTGTCGTPDGGRTVVYRLNEIVRPGQGGRVLLNVSVAPWADADIYGRQIVNWVHLDYTNSFGRPQPRVSDDDIDTLVDPIRGPGDLLVSKRAEPPFALPGDTVTWTITVTNPGDIPVTNVRVVDIVPAVLEIIGVSATDGEASYEGQTVEWRADVVEGRQVVVITVVTRVRDDAPVPFTADNIATLTGDGVPPKTSTDRIISARSLPTTGESPWTAARPWALAALLALAGLAITSLAWLRRVA